MKRYLLIPLFLFIAGCQIPPTEIVENDGALEDRSFGKIDYGKKFDLKKSVIIDTRSRFEHELSKLPRSFHLYWKDLDLKSYSGPHKAEQKRRLQKFLALKGVDPYTRVVILGKGLKGNGEEFFVAASLISLGIKKINFMDTKKLKDSLISKDIPPLENLPYWEKPLAYDFECKKGKKADFYISKKKLNKKGYQDKPSSVFSSSMKVKRSGFPKSLNINIASPKTQWAYGLAIHLREQGRNVCVVR